MAMSKGKKSKSYTSGYGMKTGAGTAPKIMGGGQKQGSGGPDKAQRGMTKMPGSKTDHKS